MRRIAFFTLEPPVLAAVVPKTIKKIVVKPYSQYSSPFIGAKSITKRGNTPPTVNEAPDAIAACMGFAWLMSFIPSSSLMHLSLSFQWLLALLFLFLVLFSHRFELICLTLYLAFV